MYIVYVDGCGCLGVCMFRCICVCGWVLMCVYVHDVYMVMCICVDVYRCAVVGVGEYVFVYSCNMFMYLSMFYL